MKLVKKWLFPVLTCLIVVGAAVLPPRISEARDAGQFGQVHTQVLAADPLPVREPPDLRDRLALYARWCTPSETIPSFQRQQPDPALTEAAVREVLMHLAEANIIPHYIAEEASLEIGTMDYILLWDPTDSISGQEPIVLWSVLAQLDKRSLWMDLDAESGLPLRLNIYDPNMAQWLPYKEPDTLPDLARRYFDLLGLDAEPIETVHPASAAPWQRLYSVPGLELCYCVSFNATMLTIGLDIVDTSTTYDG